MAEMLLINPRRRAKAKARRASPKRRRRNPVRTVRRTTPLLPARAAARATSALRRNPRRRMSARRRRNPISLGGVTPNSFLTMLKDAAVGGVGAIGVDLLMGRVNPMLPAMLQTVPGQVNVGTAFKAFATAVLGQVLAKPTRGLSRKMASGALAVQARDAIACYLPSTMALGYASPATITQGTQRVGPVRSGMNAYMKPNRTALLNAYTAPNVTPLLSRARSAREREGFRL